MQYIYGAIFLVSLVLLPLYFLFVRKKQDEPWLLALFICVAVVNLGYTMVAFSKTVEFALFANKITYFGQVCAPLCMFMIISKLCGFHYPKWVVAVLVGIAAVMFALVCTTGHLDWYYTDAIIENIAGATVLHKEYGVLHPTNLIYVVAYFVAMIAVLCVSLKKHRGASQKHACIMLAIVLGNVGLWCIQKVIPWNFELLSGIYLISALAFLCIWLMLQDYIHISGAPSVTAEEKASVFFVDSKERAEKIERILKSLPGGTTLSARQMDVLEGILDGKSRKEIAVDLHLSENTVKMHTSALYKALGVNSREEIYALIK